MAKLLMNLRGVPDDEADEVRDLLRQNAVDYYETPPNRWGLSMGAIWLREPDDYARARDLLDTYQEQRRNSARSEHEERRRAGTQETLGTLFRSDPLRFLLYLGIVGLILYFSIRPFLALIGD